MQIKLHKKATTTPAIRDYIRTNGKPVKTLARELNLMGLAFTAFQFVEYFIR